MSVNDQEFMFLLQQTKEFLVLQNIALKRQLQQYALSERVPANPLELFPVEVGQYIVVDGHGKVKLRTDEDRYELKDVETIASALSIKGGYCSVIFVLCGFEELVSEWQNGGRVIRAA